MKSSETWPLVPSSSQSSPCVGILFRLSCHGQACLCLDILVPSDQAVADGTAIGDIKDDMSTRPAMAVTVSISNSRDLALNDVTNYCLWWFHVLAGEYKESEIATWHIGLGVMAATTLTLWECYIE